MDNFNRSKGGRSIAINQTKGVLQKLSREGLVRYLEESCHIGVPDSDNATREQLIERILVSEYGKEDVEAYNGS